jgi:hypothetical protein
MKVFNKLFALYPCVTLKSTTVVLLVIWIFHATRPPFQRVHAESSTAKPASRVLNVKIYHCYFASPKFGMVIDPSAERKIYQNHKDITAFAELA